MCTSHSVGGNLFSHFSSWLLDIDEGEVITETAVPKFFAIPAGEFTHIQDVNPLICDKNGNMIYEQALSEFENAYQNNESIEKHLSKIKEIIKTGIEIPEDFEKSLKGKVGEIFGILPESLGIKNGMETINNNNIVLSVRSSFPNLEDLDKVASQGMFSSVGGIRAWDEFLPAIKKVWASKWSEIAARARMEHSIPHKAVQPAVVVQEFANTENIMTIYTRRIADPNKMLIDISQGVTSTMAGNPYLFQVNRTTGDIERILLANKGRKKLIENVNLLDKINGNYSECDYSKDVLNLEKEKYSPIIKKIANAALAVENHFSGKPQDIEGGLDFIKDAQGNVKDVKITLWQARNEQI